MNQNMIEMFDTLKIAGTDCEESFHSPLEILYRFYAEYIAADTEITRQHFQSLEPYMEKLSTVEQNAVMDALCVICTQQERESFIHGVRLGVQLAESLQESTI